MDLFHVSFVKYMLEVISAIKLLMKRPNARLFKTFPSSCLDFILNKYIAFGRACLYLLVAVLFRLRMAFALKTFFSSFTFCTPRLTTLLSLVFACSRWCSRPFPFVFKLGGSGFDAPDSSTSSLWRYIVATFPSYRLSTANRLSCCGVVLLARLILYLNFMTTNMWSDSMFASLRAFTSMMQGKCHPSIDH
jgi:hypothetical protein